VKLNDPKRTASAYYYASGYKVSTNDFSHLTYHPHRLDDPINIREKMFYEEWRKIASNTLAYLLSDEINVPDYENLSQRDLEVAATLIQWLGSNCGQAFLRETQAKADKVWRKIE
jgi:hypothetical protein